MVDEVLRAHIKINNSSASRDLDNKIYIQVPSQGQAEEDRLHLQRGTTVSAPHNLLRLWGESRLSVPCSL